VIQAGSVLASLGDSAVKCIERVVNPINVRWVTTEEKANILAERLYSGN
jgi:hypothetical protein